MPRYALALGSNRPRARGCGPAALIDAAIVRLGALGAITARAPTIATAPLGPSGRRFANAALLIKTDLPPHALLDAVKRIERAIGRRGGRRWGARVIDIDIVLWSGGSVATRRLTVPHPGLAERDFVLRPLVRIAPDWTVPRAGLRIRHLAARLTRRPPVHRSRRRSGP